jgi:ferredoxin
MARQTHVSVDGVRLACQPGSSVLSLLTDAGGHGHRHLRSLCAGRGDCGLCHIRVLEGEASPPTAGREGLGLAADVLQRAKATIAAATGALLQVAGMKPGELTRVCVCGAFGDDLHVSSTQKTGLLPNIPAQALHERARPMNLAHFAGFEDLFVESLYLEPISNKSQTNLKQISNQ